MPVTYTRAPESVRALLRDVIGRYHGELVEYQVTVGVEMTLPGESGEFPVKLHGYPCAATIAVTPYRQRVRGIEDAVITLDGEQWAGFTEQERVAILDHELEHLELVCDREGAVKADDQGRPKLKLRLHDWQLGGFESIARRYGQAAIEVQAFKAAQDRHYQAVFAWMDDLGGEAAPMEPDKPGRDVARKALGMPVARPAIASSGFLTSDP